MGKGGSLECEQDVHNKLLYKAVYESTTKGRGKNN